MEFINKGWSFSLEKIASECLMIIGLMITYEQTVMKIQFRSLTFRW